MEICSPQYGLDPKSNAGGEVYDKEILERLADRGVRINIILPHGKPAPEHENLKIYRLKIPFIHTSFLFNLAIIPQLFLIYRKTRFKILRIHSPYYVGMGGLFFKNFFAPKIKLITTYHHLENKKIFSLIDKLFIKKWDHIITVSEFTKKTIIEKYGVSEDKISVFYNGIKPTGEENFRKEETINKYGLKEKFVLAFCGLLIKRKNLPFLLNVIKKINLDDVKLLIIGDGKEKNNLIKLTDDLRIKNNVIFTGKVSEEEKNNILGVTKIFLFPSLMEGFGLAPAEAMATGVPVIASNRGSLPEVVGAGGMTLKLEEKEWVEKIKLLKNNQNLLKGLSNNARERGRGFDWNKAADGIYNLIKKHDDEYKN